MKRLLWLIALTLVAINSFAQEKIDEYYNDYFEKTYLIAASDEDELLVLLQVSGEYRSDDVYFYLEGSSTIESFVSSLKQVKQKYAEWRKVAIDNNVRSFSKDFDIYFPIITIAWYGADWRFDFSERLKPYFKVTDSGQYIAVFHAEAVSSNNEYITQKYYLVFSSVQDFDEVISKVEPAVIREKLKNKHAPDDLFK